MAEIAPQYWRDFVRLRRRIFYRALPWIPVVLLGAALLARESFDNALDPHRTKAIEALTAGSSVFSAGLGEPAKTLEYLSTHPSTRMVINNPSPVNLSNLARRFQDIMELEPSYVQMRWIDSAGKERVRVDRIGDAVTTIAPGQLQDKSQRDYFKNAMKLGTGEMYVSPLDLNVEHGKVEVPFRPVVRAALRLATANGEQRGILIINMDARGVLSSIREAGADLNENLFLINDSGYWLLGPSPEVEWGFQILGRAGSSIPKSDPDLWKAIRADNTGEAFQSGHLWLFSKYSPADILGRTRYRIVGPTWYFVSYGRKQVVFDAIDAAFRLTGYGSAILAVFLLIGLFSFRITWLEDQRTRAQEGFDRTRDALLQARRLSSLGVMVAGLAHELNTPIGAVRMTGSSVVGHLEDLLETGKEDSPEHRAMSFALEGLTLMMQSATQASDLIQRFRQVAVDRAVLERRTFFLAEVIENVLSTLHGTLKRTDHRIEVTVPPQITLEGYPGPLGQVVQNLVMNAVRHAFTGPGGRISILASQRQETVHLQVSDNGMGIDPSIIANVFDPFFTTARGSGGTGLGLYICHEVVTSALGGTISIDSEVGAGTLFKIELPIVAPFNET